MKKKKIIILSIAIIGLLLIVTGVTYSILSFRVEGTEVNIVKAGILKIDIDENEPITLLEAYPISTERGLEGDAYTFTVSNTGDIDAIYRIYLDDVELDAGIERLSDSSVRYSLTKDGKYLTDTVADLLSQRENRIIDNGAIYPGETFSYELKMWIDENVGNEEQGKVFKGKIRIEGEQLVNDTCFTVNNNTITGYSDSCSKDVIIPSKINGITITTIAQSAFQGKGLTSLVLPNTITTINRWAFRNNNLTHLEIPSSVTYITYGAFNNNQLPDDEAFIYAREADGSVDYTTLVSYAGANRDHVVVPAGVETIINAFSFQTINSVSLPDTLKTIGDSAFYNTGLTDIDIPASVTYIEPGSFRGNNLPPDKAFIYQRNADGSIDYTYLVSYGGADQEIFEIPNTVKKVANRVVYQIGAEVIVIPPSVEEIERNAFEKNQWSLTLTKIINQTGRSFDWGLIINGTSGYNFVTGTVYSQYGNVEVVSE